MDNCWRFIKYAGKRKRAAQLIPLFRAKLLWHIGHTHAPKRRCASLIKSLKYSYTLNKKHDSASERASERTSVYRKQQKHNRSTVVIHFSKFRLRIAWAVNTLRSYFTYIISFILQLWWFYNTEPKPGTSKR